MTYPNEPAAILMSMPGELRFSKDGRWYHDGVEVTHDGISRFFSRHLRYSERDNSYLIELDGKAVRVIIEDTPQVALGVDLSPEKALMKLSDGTVEVFSPETLAVSKEHVFYCKRKNGERVRILRSAAQTLYPFIAETAPGEFAFTYGAKHFPIEEVSVIKPKPT